MDDALDGEVVDEQIAVIEVAPAEQYVGEERGRDRDQEKDAPDVAAIRFQTPANWNAMGMITNSCTASNTPCAITPGNTFFVR